MNGPRGGYCADCKHAKWAHNGIGHGKDPFDTTTNPTGCDLCMCRKYREAADTPS